MKRNFLLLLVLVISAGFTGNALAQGCGTCAGDLSFTSIAYGGKVSGNDILKIAYGFTGSSAGEHCLVPTKIRFNAKITRKNGHQDSAVATFDVGINQVQLSIPRGALETDPVKYEVDGTVTEFRVKVAPASTKSFPGQTISQSADQQRVCCPKINAINIQSLGKATNGVDDLVSVSWTTQLGTPSCLNMLGVSVSVTTKHADRSTCRSQATSSPAINGQLNPIKATCAAEVTTNSPIESIEAIVSPQLKVGECYVSKRTEGSL